MIPKDQWHVKYFSSLLQKKKDLPCQNDLKTKDEYQIKHGKGRFDSFISMKEIKSAQLSVGSITFGLNVTMP
jgi:hypothetical protein